MEKKYQLVAWTRNSSDKEKARLYVVPSVGFELTKPFIDEVTECRRLQEQARGHISLKLAMRFMLVYEQSARLEILTGHIDDAIRFLFIAAEYCRRKELRYELERLCEEGTYLARRYGFEYILSEARPSAILKVCRELTQPDSRL